MPRASLRSVLLICAFSTARMCRVSTQITGKPASAKALYSHCASGPASSPIRHRALAPELSAVAQAGSDPVDGEVDAMGNALIGIAGAVAVEELDLHMVERIEIGEAVADRACQKRI